MPLPDRVALHELVLMRDVEDERVLVHLGSERDHVMDAIGATMLDAALEHGPRAALQVLTERFDAPVDLLVADLERLRDRLADSGIIATSGGR